MAQHKKLTPEVIPQIKTWVSQGLNVHDIAQKIGCTVGTLRVRCSQLGISLRLPKTDRRPPGAKTVSWRTLGSYAGRDPNDRDEPLLLLVQEITLRRLRRRAAIKGLSHSILAASLLEKIAQDDLYDAVLDDE